MAKRKLKRIERIIIISFIFSAVVMMGFWIMDKNKELAIKQKPYVFARIKDTLDRRILIYQRRAYRPDLQIFLYQATSQYQGKTVVGGVSVGDSIDKISSIYGQPNKRIESIHGYFLVYEKYKIIFFIRENKVEEWTLYYVL